MIMSTPTTKTTTIRDNKTWGSTNSFGHLLSRVATLSWSWNVVVISVATGIVITIITKNSLVTLTYDRKPNCDAHNKLWPKLENSDMVPWFDIHACIVKARVVWGYEWARNWEKKFKGRSWVGVWVLQLRWLVGSWSVGFEAGIGIALFNLSLMVSLNIDEVTWTMHILHP